MLHTDFLERKDISIIHCLGVLCASGIQGRVADATVDILAYHDILPAFKWVDDFNFFQEPSKVIDPFIPGDPETYEYSYDLSTIINITSRLGIPWQPVSKKGHDFAFNSTYCGFD